MAIANPSGLYAFGPDHLREGVDYALHMPVTVRSDGTIDAVGDGDRTYGVVQHVDEEEIRVCMGDFLTYGLETGPGLTSPPLPLPVSASMNQNTPQPLSLPRRLRVTQDPETLDITLRADNGSHALLFHPDALRRLNVYYQLPGVSFSQSPDSILFYGRIFAHMEDGSAQRFDFAVNGEGDNFMATLRGLLRDGQIAWIQTLRSEFPETETLVERLEESNREVEVSVAPTGKEGPVAPPIRPRPLVRPYRPTLRQLREA